jgi:glycerol-3-phosphate dehydrogenase
VSEVQAAVLPNVPAPEIELVAGTHIVLNQAPPGGVFYVESPSDQRAVFIMPWYGQTLVGTTERAFHGDPAQIQASEHEIEYLLAIVRYYFPRYSQEVERAFAGARVLPRSEKSLFHRSRETLFFTHAQLPGYVSLMGGKLTAYRLAALKTLEFLQTVLPSRTQQADTSTIKVHPVEQWDVGC